MIQDIADSQAGAKPERSGFSKFRCFKTCFIQIRDEKRSGVLETYRFCGNTLFIKLKPPEGATDGMLDFRFDGCNPDHRSTDENRSVFNSGEARIELSY